MKTTIIYNPSAGRERGETTALAIRKHLASRGQQTELRPTQGPGHAKSIAAESVSFSRVIVAVGGDGTINEIVNGMAQASDAALLSGRARPECTEKFARRDKHSHLHNILAHQVCCHILQKQFLILQKQLRSNLHRVCQMFLDFSLLIEVRRHFHTNNP